MSATEKNGKVPVADVPDEEEEGEQGDDEDYEIEAILNHQSSKAKRGWEYLVSWVGYGPEHNSWVVETDFLSHDLIDEYWAKNGGRPVKSGKQTGRPSKSSQAASAPAASSSARRRRNASPVERSIDVDKPTSSKRHRGVSSGSNVEDGVGEDDNEVFAETHMDPMDAYKDLADWEDKVATIETIERGANNNLVVYMIMVGGEKTAQDVETAYKRCPMKMFKFYESHLRWRQA